MISHSKIIIDRLYFDGLINPKLRIKGHYVYDKVKLKCQINDKSIVLKNNIILDKKYVVDRILKNDNNFDYYIDIPKNSSNLKIFIDEDLLVSINISFLNIVLNKIITSFKRIISILKRIPLVVIKSIRIIWRRHHFIIPPRMLKQYLNSFINNMSNKNIDELFYNPLIDKDYNSWLKEQNNNYKIKRLSYNPKISIVIPVYNVSRKILSECLDSILNQSYRNFEICIADDNSKLDETIDTLKDYEKNYKNIKVIYRNKNGHISEASNSAISLATGEFIGLVDNDDILHKDALYEMVKKLNKNKQLDLIYSDEDKLDFKGKRCFPHFKPDFSIDTLLSSNYICHFTIIRKIILDEVNGFRSEYNGAQDYDLFLRIIEKTKRIGHVSKVLYHWRMTEGSTSSNSSNKNYAYEAGKRALEDYFKRNKIKAKVHLIGEPQMYDIEYLYDKEPLISIIIPTKDKSDVLDTCLKSIYKRTNYSNFEIIIIDNNSEEEETQDLLKKYKKNYDNFSYYRYECEFNYSYLNNEGIKKSKGDYIVLLNNDTEIISEDWLKKMVGYAMQRHIGCVGTKLLYPNRTIQHSGVVIGVGGIAMHAFVSTGENEYGYFGRLVSVYDWSCVTAACLMIKKSKYLEVEGLDERLKVAYNDVDFNLKILSEGYYNVVIPSIKIYHYESLSRGNDMNYNQINRFKSETDYMCDKWGNELLRDKFYNDNFSYDYAFRLDRTGVNGEKDK